MGEGTVCPGTCVESKEQFEEASFSHMGPQDQTQAIRLGNKLLYSLSCGVGPRIINFYKCLFQTFLVTAKNHLRQVMKLSNTHL